MQVCFNTVQQLGSPSDVTILKTISFMNTCLVQWAAYLLLLIGKNDKFKLVTPERQGQYMELDMTGKKKDEKFEIEAVKPCPTIVTK